MTDDPTDRTDHGLDDDLDDDVVEGELVDEEEDADGGPADLLGSLLGGGGMDMGSLLDQAMAMQTQLASAQQAAAGQEVEGVAGGGAVKVVVTGGFEFRSVHIDPSAVDPDDVGLLEDLVLAALHDAVARVGDLNQSAMGSLDLGALGGMLGIGGDPAT